MIIGGPDLDAHRMMTDRELGKKRNQSMEEIYKKYGHHQSFYGWYFPNESWLDPYFCDFVIPYVNECAQVAKSLNANCMGHRTKRILRIERKEYQTY